MNLFINTIDQALRTVFAPHHAARPNPAAGMATVPMTDAERQEAGALMRVNHVGEVCAQALYASQALATKNPQLRAHFLAASAEETDHLAWTETRLTELGSRPSLLNPLWYAGAFGLGFIAGKLGGDAMSLGFVVETERQVEAHLNRHLTDLPESDVRSRAIVAQMRDDEIAHGAAAQELGATALPAPVRSGMQIVSKVMTATAYYI